MVIVFFDLRLLAAKNKNYGSRKCFPDAFFQQFSGFLDVNLVKLSFRTSFVDVFVTFSSG